MAKKLTSYKAKINAALKHIGRTPKALAVQVETLASAMLTLDMANNEIAQLDSVTITECSRFGGTTLKPHPAFKIQRDAQDSVTRQLKALGLTAADLPDDLEEDPLTELTQDLLNVKEGKVYPD